MTAEMIVLQEPQEEETLHRPNEKAEIVEVIRNADEGEVAQVRRDPDLGQEAGIEMAKPLVSQVVDEEQEKAAVVEILVQTEGETEIQIQILVQSMMIGVKAALKGQNVPVLGHHQKNIRRNDVKGFIDHGPATCYLFVYICYMIMNVK